jgi:hypothetical protein
MVPFAVVVQLFASVTRTEYTPEVKFIKSSVVDELFQAKEYGEIPPVTVKFKTPFAEPKQVTFVAAIEALKTDG